MNAHQKVALKFPCRLGIETTHPRFCYVVSHAYSIVLTINNGYE